MPWSKRWPRNVWLGTTVEDQAAAEARLPHLVTISSVVRFISAEPLVGPLDLSRWIDRLDWVIADGESGVHAMPSSPSHFWHLRDQCIDAGVPFLFKRWGEYTPASPRPQPGRLVEAADGSMMRRVGKAAAGRSLGCRTWDEFPVARG